MPKLSIAPMVDVTNRHFRYLCRLLTKQTVLYTPMLVAHQAIHQRDALWYDPLEQPLVAQIGGSHEATVVEAAQLCEARGFQQVNMNLGCPAKSAQKSSHGAIMMLDPDTPSLLRSMCRNVGIPVTVKCRIGVNEFDSYDWFSDFIQRVADAGVKEVVVHARKALVSKSHTAKYNRVVPPLRHDWVYRLKKEMPHLIIHTNGGVTGCEDILEHLRNGVDGVMMGRLAVQDTYFLTQLDALIEANPIINPVNPVSPVVSSNPGNPGYPSNPGLNSTPNLVPSTHASFSSLSQTPSAPFPQVISRAQAITEYAAYARTQELDLQVPKIFLLLPLQNMFHAVPSTKCFRRSLNELPRDMPIDEIILSSLAATERSMREYRDRRPVSVS